MRQSFDKISPIFITMPFGFARNKARIAAVLEEERCSFSREGNNVLSVNHILC